MSQKEKELREAISQAAEELADELVKWQAKKPEYTFSEMEEKVLGLRARFGKKVTEAILETREASLPVPGPCCPQCGEEMRYKEKTTLQHTSELGQLEVERGYYYCTHCKSGVFPPG
jgi:DNA repair exonuclease SbcCD ATPase subunit